ncbi:hypothetical protein [Clostridium estertheticum]|uniref:hypothetical protein n=1 Tax=Clostridium estertheticum TaxID=238834 RepID=UPI001C7DBD29|nr:hypothetical protein [Clostridium estertheticum]MBX4264440.1 hypothetical protein [Clostridium estertheticum]MBX4271335.1 hypothetical protein [Clostridium estertheticum]WLC78252.1 hypothetical protein KTC98_13520 [Clostridium estertheticum]WLC89282.1 hypothetical protein KTC95_03370 [Clostridium estertheticum]
MDDVYEIIRDNQKYKLILEKLDVIESKIDNITLNGTIKKMILKYTSDVRWVFILVQ